MNWLEIAKNLPLGQTARCDCPQCGVGTNTNAAIVNHNPKYYSVYCNACDCREYESKGETVTQVLEVPVNDKGYLEAAFIDKTEDYFNNKVNRGWMEADKAEKAKNSLLEKGVSSIFQVKVN